MELRNRKSPRNPNWDYGTNAAYFITICIANRRHFFGEIENGKMKLSQAGTIADHLWHEIKNHAKNIALGEFVVMPNHIHGILIINGNPDPDSVRTTHALSQPIAGKLRYQNQGKNTVSSIIGSYKSAVTKHCNRSGIDFGWQSRYHDHIIRSELSYYRIAEYIKNNPLNWKEDSFHKR